MTDRFDGGDESRVSALMAENERLRETLREARDWIDSIGDFMARPMDLLGRLDEALDA